MEVISFDMFDPPSLPRRLLSHLSTSEGMTISLTHCGSSKNKYASMSLDDRRRPEVLIASRNTFYKCHFKFWTNLAKFGLVLFLVCPVISLYG